MGRARCGSAGRLHADDSDGRNALHVSSASSGQPDTSLGGSPSGRGNYRESRAAQPRHVLY